MFIADGRERKTKEGKENNLNTSSFILLRQKQTRLAESNGPVYFKPAEDRTSVYFIILFWGAKCCKFGGLRTLPATYR